MRQIEGALPGSRVTFEFGWIARPGKPPPHRSGVDTERLRRSLCASNSGERDRLAFLCARVGDTHRLREARETAEGYPWGYEWPGPPQITHESRLVTA
jgi:hypothetical protein